MYIKSLPAGINIDLFNYASPPKGGEASARY